MNAKQRVEQKRKERDERLSKKLGKFSIINSNGKIVIQKIK
jgi:hypothetical protein